MGKPRYGARLASAFARPSSVVPQSRDSGGQEGAAGSEAGRGERGYRLFFLFGIDPDRDGPIIGELDIHMRAEYAALNRFAQEFFQAPAEIGVHAVRKFRRRSSDERRAITFLGAGKQSELGDHQYLAVAFCD